MLAAAPQRPSARMPRPARRRSAAAPGKPEVPKDCTVLIVGGPQHDYIQPETDAIKAYVEGGGHALFLMDPALNLGRTQTDENATLDALLQSWGVTLNKDLALDTSGIGQVFGLGPEVPLVASYDSHPIVNDLKEVATAFPLTRTLDTKNGEKTTVEKLFATGDEQLRHYQPQLRLHPHRSQEGQEGPAHAGGRRHVQWPDAGAVRGGGQFHVGRQQLHPVQRQPRPVPQHDQLAHRG